MIERKGGIKGKSGQALIETALALPVLLLLSFLVVDGGRVFYVRNTINNIARDEVRMLATDPRLNANYVPASGTKEEAILAAIGEATDRITGRLSLANGVSVAPRTGGGIQVRVPGTAGVPGNVKDNPLEVRISRTIGLITGSLLPVPGAGSLTTTVSSSGFVEQNTESGNVDLNLAAPGTGDPITNPQDACRVSGLCSCATNRLLCTPAQLDQLCLSDPTTCTLAQRCDLLHESEPCCNLHGVCTPEQVCRMDGLNSDQCCRADESKCVSSRQRCRYYGKCGECAAGDNSTNCCEVNGNCSDNQTCELHPWGDACCAVRGENCNAEQNCRIHDLNCTCWVDRNSCASADEVCLVWGECVPDQLCQLDSNRCDNPAQLCRLHPEDSRCALEA